MTKSREFSRLTYWLCTIALLVGGKVFAEQACELDERGAARENQRDQLVELLLTEIEDHRYEVCDDESICVAHVSGFAERIASLDAELASACDRSVWRTGVGGMVDLAAVPNGTLDLYADDESRHRLHEALVARRLIGEAQDEGFRDAVMTMGAPGSGKSSILRELGLCQQGEVIVDPDLFKTDLVEYQVARAAHDRLAADRVHRESSMLAKRLRDAAIESRRDLCIDGVLSKRDAALEQIERLQAAGYEVVIVAAVVPFEVSYQRVLDRGEVTGRFVPHEFALQAHANIENHRDDLLRAADRGYAFDTSVPLGVTPPLIIEYQNGQPVTGTTH